jgi:hypothetical protein
MSFVPIDAERDVRTVDAMKSTRRKLLLIVFFLTLWTLMLRKRGYNVGGVSVVRCRRGHLFTTIWIPGLSVKSIRLGWYRFLYCPVGRHWTLVKPVRNADLSDDELRSAYEHRDVRLP